MPYSGMCAAEHATTEYSCGRCGAPTQSTADKPTDSGVPSQQQPTTPVLTAAPAPATCDARVVGGGARPCW